MIDDALAGLAGALKGGWDAFTWAKEFEQKDRQLNNQVEIARLRDEIRMMAIEAGLLKHQTPSGNVVAQQAGAAARNDADNQTTRDVAAGNQQVTMRGQDITKELGIMRDVTQRRGQDFTFDLGVIRDNTTRRGQDITSETARRGQDITQQLGITAEAGRKTRATDANALRREEMASRERIAKDRNADPWGVSTTSGVTFGDDGEVTEDTGTGKPTAAPIEVRETTGTTPVAPRSPEAADDQLSRLEQQAAATIQKYRTEKDPAKKAALRNDLTRLRGEISKAQQRDVEPFRQKSPGGY
jgi:hypothetical protein